MNRTFASLTLTAMAASACAAQPASDVRRIGDPNDIAAIYEAFLNAWNEREHMDTKVSRTAAMPSAEEVEDFSDCANDGPGSRIAWQEATPINNLGDVIPNLPHVHFVDPKKWHPTDPGALIAKGQSIESSVDTGFNHGLMTLSAITFDELHQTAALSYSFVCGETCGNGGSVLFKNVSGKWIRSDKFCGEWMS